MRRTVIRVSSAIMSLDLPPLSDEPKRYPDFCLSLSTPLIQSLTAIFTEAARKAKAKSNLILSVGSGSGLLEAHLQAHWSSSSSSKCDLYIHGVEIHTGTDSRPVNRYLPEQNCNTVKATWQLSPDLHIATALLFVYPRDPDLVLRYMQAVQDHESSVLQAVVWLGPRADFDPFTAFLQHLPGFDPVQVFETRGLASYEMMAIIWRKAK